MALTQEEMEVLQRLADAWNAFMALPVEHSDQVAEFRHPLHDLQRQVLARPASRLLKATPTEGQG